MNISDSLAGTAAKVNRSIPVGFSLIPIPGGIFLVGSTDVEEGRCSDEGPQTALEVSSFLMGSHPVTQEEFQLVMGRNPSYFRNGAHPDLCKRPVESVSWFDAIEFCNTRSLQEGLTPRYYMRGIKRNKYLNVNAAVVGLVPGSGYRLPTEAEWEYACRAGTSTPFHFGNVLDDKLANVKAGDPYCEMAPGVSRGGTTIVGSYPPNAFGLYDMHGNVWEWCYDVYDAAAYSSRCSVRIDPQLNCRGDTRVLRGGAWSYFAADARSARRLALKPHHRYPFAGFRVARSA
jgi:formylglycine-generating enzyme required for sulfatase activity